MGDIDLCDMDCVDFRVQIVFVLQDVVIFVDIVCENICFGCFDVIDVEVEVVVQVVVVYEFLLVLLDGYDIYVGECGVMLLGGQKQWIVIVCVILCNVLILLFDEVILVFDVESECLVQQVVDCFLVDCIMLIVVYWLVIVKKVDWIVVFDEGKIVVQGIYDELVVEGGLYV